MKKVLILDANQRSALAVTRSLGRQGVPLITADETPTSIAGNSRYSGFYSNYPSPKTQPAQFIEYLVKLISDHKVDMVIPMTELTTTLLLSNQSAFSHVILPFAELNTVNMLSDKCQLMRMSKNLNIPVPKTWFVETVDDLPKLDTLPFPLVIKPGKSWLQDHGTWNRYEVRFAQHPSDAEKIIMGDPAFHNHPFLLQECVPGFGRGIFALYDRGTPVAFFAHRRLREKPPSGGVSVLSESTSLDPQTLFHAKTLLDHVGWHGVAMVEFKVDPLTNTPYLMEVNTRFWGSLQLSIDAGVDFPWLLYQLACGTSPGASAEYRVGIRSRWLLGDVDNLYLTLRSNQLKFKQKLAAVASFLTPHPSLTYHEINRWSDLGPFWCEIKQYVRSIIS